MPLYEYLCRDCDREVEVLVRGDSDTPRCPDCGSEGLARLLSVPAAPVVRSDAGPPPGPCGSACGCFPAG